MKSLKNPYFMKGEFTEIEGVPTKLIYTYHAEEQMRERLVSKERVMRLIERGFYFLLEDAKRNLQKNNYIYSELINTQSFRAVIFASWNCDLNYLNIAVITVILDFYKKKRKRKSNTNVYRL